MNIGEHNLSIRKLETDDAKNFVLLTTYLSEESNFMLLTRHEAEISPEKQQKLTQKMNENKLSIVFVAEKNNSLVGFLGATRGAFEKNKHSCHFALGVLKDYQKNNIATKLIQKMEAWAANESITRIELSVMTDNVPAIALYHKCGYKVEGLKIASIQLSDRTVNELLMYKLIC